MALDKKGNIAIQPTYATPIGLSNGIPDLTRPLGEIVDGASFKAIGSASIMSTKTTTNAPDVNSLLLPTVATGGSGGYSGIMAGAEYLNIQDPQNKATYHGLTVSKGLGTGVEAHGGASNTVSYENYNLFDIADRIYQKFMEW